ncbi:MAG: mgtA [Patescibacteria group bacterium]|nr:mgtA [Patescibacteria group bacterium]
MNTDTTGLTSREAAKRLKHYGPNTLAEVKRRPAVLAFLSRFTNPLVIILMLAATLSAFLGDRLSFIIIIAIVLVSTVLDFFNTFRSEKAAEALKERVRVEAEVLRDHKWVALPLRALVPGDIVKLQAGKLIPADGVVAEGKDLYANESSLTGESFPQPKPPAAPLYLGASITSGSGTMRVTHTGHATKFSHLAHALSAQDQPTEFDREIKDFSLLIIKITTFLVIVIFTFNLFFRHDLLSSLLFSVALAVGLTPELLPLIITLNLTKGSLAMAKHGVIVKQLSSIQNLGSMDVLCTDKTGTLTEDHIALIRHVDGFGAESSKVLLYGYLASVYTTGFENPLDKAVRTFKTVNIKGYRKLDEIPYDFERKRESVVVAHGDSRLLISKGAPEEIMRISHRYADGRPFEAVKAEVQAEYDSLSAEGFRVLAVAIHHVPPTHGTYEPGIEHDLTFVGFMAFLDPAKQSVRSTLERILEYGIQVKIVTGDNALVTRKIANDINLEVTGILTGPEIERMSQTKLREAVERTTIFARVNPEQKLRIIETLRHNHHVVGYLGDGINDAPALKAADVGISVNNAVDVARATADLILLRKSLDSLIEGVIEGRRTYANTLKYLMMSLGSNFGNMFSMAGGSLFLPFLPMQATQILLTNLLYDSSQFALPLDGVDADSLKRPRRLNIATLKKAMWVFGPLSSIFDFATFGVLILVFHLNAASFQTGWFLESVATQTFVVYIIRTRLIPFFQSRPSPYLVLSTLATVALGYYLALSPLGSYFHFGPLPLSAFLAILGIVVAYLFSAEIVKRQFFRRVDL